MEKTLGGDRLGSGKRMQVQLHGYERSTHDLGYLWRSTMSAGTLVPFLSLIGLPGDTMDINLNLDIKTHPTIGPLFGSYKAQADVFMVPIRLYNAALHNNALNIGRNMQNIYLPQLHLFNGDGADTGEDLDNSQINPSCILAYLGIRGIGIGNSGETGRFFNAVSFLSYWDIVKNYYANKQEELGAVLHTPSIALVQTIDSIEASGNNIPIAPGVSLVQLQAGTDIVIAYTGATPVANQIYIKTQYHGDIQLSSIARFASAGVGTLTFSYNYSNYGLDYAISYRYQNATDVNQVQPEVATFALENIDDMRMQILSAYSLSTPYVLDGNTAAPYGYVLETVNDRPNALSSQEGLALKTYQSDLFNNWMNTDFIDDVNLRTAIDTTSGSFTIDQLQLSKKVYDMLNRINVSGGTYDDWLDAVYTHDRITRAETPIYMGGLSKELVFQEVVSNAQASMIEGTSQPLGTLAGKGVMAKKHKGGHIVVKVDEPCYIMGIVSLTPRIDYSQGNSWDVNLQTLDDLHKPALDQIGFQDLIMERQAWWTTTFGGGVWTQKATGKQPAWIEYMTAVNKTYGNFAIASNEMFMTLNRRYEYDPGDGIADLTTYIDPSKFNFIFANTAIDSQNFWVQMAVDIEARRKMSAKVMPNL